MHVSGLVGTRPIVALLWSLVATTLTAQLSPLTPAMPAPRSRAGTALDTTTGRVVMYGGTMPTADTHLWEFDGSVWHLRAAAGNGPLYLSWGSAAYDTARARFVVYAASDTWEWDGASWSLRQTASAPGSLAYGMVFDGTRCLLLSEQAAQYVLWAWNGTSWTLVAPAGPARIGATPPAMAFDPVRNEVLLFGGATNDPYTGQTIPLAAMNRWNGTAWTTVPVAASWPAARYDAAFAFDLGRGVTVLHGGRGAFFGTTPIADVVEWNGTAWSAAQPAPAVYGHALVWTPPGTAALLTIGGSTGQVHVWNGTQWRTLVSQGLPGSSGRYSVVDAGSRLLGVNLQAHDGSVSEWSGNAWRVLDQAAFPFAQFDLGVTTFDSARGVLVTLTSITSTTFEWSSATGWRQRSPALSPLPRDGAAITYDPSRQRVVLFGGGSNATGALRDTWEYDGTNWINVATPSSPSPRAYATMAFDPATQRPLLVGGVAGGTATLLAEAWALQAGSWVALPPPAGGGAYSSYLAVDRASNRLVYYNRDNGASSRWNGSAWSSLANIPIVAIVRGMASDPSTGDLLVFTAESHSPATRLAPTAAAAVSVLGTGCAVGPPPSLLADVPWLGNPRFLLEARGVGGGGLCVFGLSTSTASQSLGNCTLLLGGSPILLDAPTNFLGTASVAMPIPVLPALRGAVFYAQAGSLGAAGFALTPALRLVVGD